MSQSVPFCLIPWCKRVACPTGTGEGILLRKQTLKGHTNSPFPMKGLPSGSRRALTRDAGCLPCFHYPVSRERYEGLSLTGQNRTKADISPARSESRYLGPSNSIFQCARSARAEWDFLAKVRRVSHVLHPFRNRIANSPCSLRHLALYAHARGMPRDAETPRVSAGRSTTRRRFPDRGGMR